MDDAVIQYIKKTYNLLIGERTAEQIKMELGSAFPLDERLTMETYFAKKEGRPLPVWKNPDVPVAVPTPAAPAVGGPAPGRVTR